MIGKKLLQANISKDQVIIEAVCAKYSASQLQEIKEIFESQDKIVYSQQCCPNCLGGITVSKSTF